MSDEQDWDAWIETIQDTGVNLTKWEEEFCESVHERRNSGRCLTQRQVEILERIYAEKTP